MSWGRHLIKLGFFLQSSCMWYIESGLVDQSLQLAPEKMKVILCLQSDFQPEVILWPMRWWVSSVWMSLGLAHHLCVFLSRKGWPSLLEVWTLSSNRHPNFLPLLDSQNAVPGIELRTWGLAAAAFTTEHILVHMCVHMRIRWGP